MNGHFNDLNVTQGKETGYSSKNF